MNLGELKKELAKFDDSDDDLSVQVTTGGYNESLYEVTKVSERISKNPDISPYVYILIVG